MKTILYVFAFVWFLVGLGVLIGGPQLGMGALLGGGAASDVATLGWLWLWTFPMPSLLASALGAVLGRLDDIRDTIEYMNEREIPDETHQESVERMDPYIGEGYLDTSERNHTLR